MRGGETAAGDQHVLAVARDERAERDADALAVGKITPSGVGPTVVILDGRAAEGDLVVELFGPDDVIAGEAVLAVNTAGFTHPDVDAEGGELGLLVAGDFVAQETDVLDRLNAALDLGGGEEFGVGGVDDGGADFPIGRQPGHDRGGHVIHGRDMVAAFLARQLVEAALGGSGHEIMKLFFRDGLAERYVHVDQFEGGGEGLRGIYVAGEFVTDAGEMADVGVARGIDDDLGGVAAQAGLGGDDEGGDEALAGFDIEDLGVKQDVHAGSAHEFFPDHLKVFGVIGDTGAGAVGVGAFEPAGIGAKAIHDVLGDTVDHTDGAGAGRVEAVKGVEYSGGSAAEEGQAFEQEHLGAGAAGGDGGGGASGTGADHNHIVGGEVGDLLGVSVHGGDGGNGGRERVVWELFYGFDGGGIVERSGIASALIANPQVIGVVGILKVHVAQNVVGDLAAIEFTQGELVEALHDADAGHRGERANGISARLAINGNRGVADGHAVVDEQSVAGAFHDLVQVFTRGMFGGGSAGLGSRAQADDRIIRVTAHPLARHVHGRLGRTGGGDNKQRLTGSDIVFVEDFSAQTLDLFNGLVDANTVGTDDIGEGGEAHLE
jgi:hypothetical protein